MLAILFLAALIISTSANWDHDGSSYHVPANFVSVNGDPMEGPDYSTEYGNIGVYPDEAPLFICLQHGKFRQQCRRLVNRKLVPSELSLNSRKCFGRIFCENLNKSRIDFRCFFLKTGQLAVQRGGRVKKQKPSSYRRRGGGVSLVREGLFFLQQRFRPPQEGTRHDRSIRFRLPESRP